MLCICARVHIAYTCACDHYVCPRVAYTWFVLMLRICVCVHVAYTCACVHLVHLYMSSCVYVCMCSCCVYVHVCMLHIRVLVFMLCT